MSAALNANDIVIALIVTTGSAVTAGFAAWARYSAHKAEENTRPVSNGAIPEIKQGIDNLHTCLVELNQRIDRHLEDHPPKARRGRWR